jgi:hypothetical protein
MELSSGEKRCGRVGAIPVTEASDSRRFFDVRRNGTELDKKKTKVLKEMDRYLRVARDKTDFAASCAVIKALSNMAVFPEQPHS